MEIKVFGSRAVCLIGLVFAAAHVHAGGGALTGGATEATQLMNNAELIHQVGEAVNTTANTLMTAQSTMQMLRQLPENIVKEALGGLPVEKVRALADAYQVMSKAVGVYRDAEILLRQAHHDSVRLNVTPQELLRMKAESAYRYGGVYLATYQQEQAKLKQLAEVSKDVQRQAEIVKGIDSNVGGIQALASQNLNMQATLAHISSSIATANANAALAAHKAQMELGDAHRHRELEIEELRRNQEKAKAVRDNISFKGVLPE